SGGIVGQRPVKPEEIGIQTGCGREAPGNRVRWGHMLKKNKVVLFYPPYDGPPLGAPLCLLSLASPLLAAGFEVTLVDAAIARDWEERVVREVQDALCLGISVLTGPMIRGAVRIAKLVKQTNPECPVIFGGWHP